MNAINSYLESSAYSLSNLDEDSWIGSVIGYRMDACNAFGTAGSYIYGASIGVISGCVSGCLLSGILNAGIYAINPVTGAIFGATFMVIKMIAQPIFESWLGYPESDKARCVSYFAAMSVSIITTKFLMQAGLGIALTAEAALYLAICTSFYSVCVLVCTIAAGVIIYSVFCDA